MYIEDWTEVGYDGTPDRQCTRWVPKTRIENIGEPGYGDVEFYADGIGKRVIEVIDVHKPGRFQTRVFYRQTWIDPEGKSFGKNSLRIEGIASFESRLRGWRYRFDRWSISGAGTAGGIMEARRFEIGRAHV